MTELPATSATDTAQAARAGTPAGPQASPGSPPTGPPFEAALGEQLARTAPAEGHEADGRGDTASDRRAHDGPCEAQALVGASLPAPAALAPSQGQGASAGVAAPATAGAQPAAGPTKGVAAASGASTPAAGEHGPAAQGMTPPPEIEPAATEGAAQSTATADSQVTGAAATEAAATTAAAEQASLLTPRTSPAQDAVRDGQPDAASAIARAATAAGPSQAAPSPSSPGPSPVAAAPQQGAVQSPGPTGAEERQDTEHDAGSPSPRASEETGAPAGALASGGDPTSSGIAASATPGRSAAPATPLGPSNGAGIEATTTAAGQTGQAGAAQAPAGATVTAPAAADPAAGSPPPSLAPGYGVDLNEAIENVHATIELAARRGLTQARIELEPAELGAIRIHLTQTAAGLLARVSAESAVASQALAAAHAELRQSLGGIGIDLAHLHVGAHGSPTADAEGRGTGEQAAGAFADPRQAGAQTAAGSANGEGSAAMEAEEADAGATTGRGATDPTEAEHEAYAPGVLVDVLV